MKWVSRPFMRFMKPDTAEKFLQSHYCKITEIMIIMTLRCAWVCCFYVYSGGTDM
jgi:hypothetical protein